MTAFQPEYAGKMNFYLSAVNDLLGQADDQPSIGLILCKTKDRVYVLREALRRLLPPDAKQETAQSMAANAASPLLSAGLYALKENHSTN